MDEPDDPGGATDVSVDDDQSLPIDRDAYTAFVRGALRAAELPDGTGLEVHLVDESRIAELKELALGVHAATDVLAFPMDDPAEPMPGPFVLGALVVCPAVADRQARALGRSLEDELAELSAHGILHMLGHDHDDPEAEHAMARAQRSLVAAARRPA